MEMIAHCIHKSCSHSVGSCTGCVHQEQESWGPSQSSAYLSVPFIDRRSQGEAGRLYCAGSTGAWMLLPGRVCFCFLVLCVPSSRQQQQRRVWFFFFFFFFLARTTSKNVVEYFFWATFPVFLGNIQPCFFCPLMDGIRTIMINLFLLN